jgi:hypothetical protein
MVSNKKKYFVTGFPLYNHEVTVRDVNAHSEFYYSAFHRFGQAKFVDASSILSLSQLLIQFLLTQNFAHDMKIVKNNSRVTISIH